MTLTAHLDHLLLYDPGYARTTVNIWVARPSPTEEAALGKLFMLSLIDSADAINQEIIGLIQEETKKHYYHQTDGTAERALESALEQTNRRLHQLITEGINRWVDQAHLLIGVIHHQQLVLAPAGTIHGYLLHGARIHDILGPGEQGKIQPLRIFSQLVVGRLDVHDRLLFCTPSLLDYFSLEKLRRTIVEYPAHETVRILEGTLLGADPENAFAALIINVEAPAAGVLSSPAIAGTQVRQAATPQLSMDQLIAREQATEKLLAPSLWPTILQIAGSIRQAAGRFIRTVILRRPPRRVVSAGAIPPAGRGPAHGAGYIRLLWLRLIRLVRRLTPVRSVSGVVPRIGSKRWWSIGGTLSRLVLWFQGLSRRRQTLLTAVAALLLILSISIVRGGGSGLSERSADQALALTDHLNKAEAALLYGGDATATEELQAAETLLNQLPNRRADDKAQRQVLADRLAQLSKRIARQTTIPDPTVVVRFTPELPAYQPRQLYLLKNQLVALDPEQNVAVAAITGRTPPTVIPATVDIGQPRTGTVSGLTSLVFVTDRLGFVELETVKKTWKPLDATLPRSGTEVQFISFFQNRLYVLDRAHDMILRFAKGASSLGLGQPWLKEPADLHSARAAVVDGSIYVLQPGGRVEQYANGRLAEFRLAAIRPALTDATRLWTDSASDNLYLLDPGQQRVVVFNKRGQLVQQYTSPSWTTLHDVVADERAKHLYVLSGSTVYQVDL